MKRRDFLRATGAAAVALIVSGPPVRGADDSPGSVKAGLYPTSPEENADGQAGWAILNTNAQDELIVQVHLAQGMPDMTYAITLNLAVNGGVALAAGSLATNGEGNGNAHVVVPIDAYVADSDTAIEVRVVLAVAA